MIIPNTHISVFSQGNGDDFDVDAAAYFSACSITDTTEKNAVNQWFLDVKGGATSTTTNQSDLFTSIIKAAYLMSPTSLAAAKCNAVDPGTFDLTAGVDPAHANTGLTFDGATTWLNTNLTPSVTLGAISCGIHIYSRTNVSENAVDMGCTVNVAQQYIVELRHTTLAFFSDCYDGTTGRINRANPDSRQFHSHSRIANTDQRLFRNGVQLGAVDSGAAPTIPDIPLYLGARNNAGVADNFTTREYASAYITLGMVQGEIDDLFDADNRYQDNVIAGGRKV